MIHITATFKGPFYILEQAYKQCFKYVTNYNIKNEILSVTWVCEEENYDEALLDCHDLVFISRLDDLGVDFVSIQ